MDQTLDSIIIRDFEKISSECRVYEPADDRSYMLSLKNRRKKIGPLRVNNKKYDQWIFSPQMNKHHQISIFRLAKYKSI